MRRPFRKYCFQLAEKLHRPLSEILSWDCNIIAEWMAYDLTTSEEWVETYEKNKELDRQRNMSAMEQAMLFKKLLGGK